MVSVKMMVVMMFMMMSNLSYFWRWLLNDWFFFIFICCMNFLFFLILYVFVVFVLVLVVILVGLDLILELDFELVLYFFERGWGFLMKGIRGCCDWLFCWYDFWGILRGVLGIGFCFLGIWFVEFVFFVIIGIWGIVLWELGEFGEGCNGDMLFDDEVFLRLLLGRLGRS